MASKKSLHDSSDENAKSERHPPESRADETQVTFRDWGFRLVVLEALHELGELGDAFERAKEAASDAEENTVSEAAKKILDAVPLTPSTLAKVEKLAINLGEVHHSVTSFWDGEGDELDVASVADIALLPNLREVSVVCMLAYKTSLEPIAKLPNLKRFRCTIGTSWAQGLEAFTPLAERGVSVELSN